MVEYSELVQAFGAELANKILRKAQESDGIFKIRRDDSRLVYVISVSHCGTETSCSKVLDPWYLYYVWTVSDFIQHEA